VATEKNRRFALRKLETRTFAGLSILLMLALTVPGASVAGQGDKAVEGTSLLGRPLIRPELPEDFRIKQTALLEAARKALAKAPADPEALIWVGRRTAYLGRYGEAIEIYSRGIEAHPGNAALYRHRGHRYISIRRLDEAIADLSRAAELIAGQPDVVEQDGLPNALGIPTGTLQSNIWYHLGLAHYLQGNFEAALEAYREDLAVASNPDMFSATSYWLYMTLRRLGRDDEGAKTLEPITANMKIIENFEYHRLLQVFQGELDAGDVLAESRGDGDTLGSATTGYGIGNWHLINGRTQEARGVFEEIVAGGQWVSFGYIAAEAELARGDG
jgi:tetratricopeptide (TPR) repeat protein